VFTTIYLGDFELRIYKSTKRINISNEDGNIIIINLVEKTVEPFNSDAKVVLLNFHYEVIKEYEKDCHYECSFRGGDPLESFDIYFDEKDKGDLRISSAEFRWTAIINKLLI